MKTCFVITGYGVKKDYINNRDIDLDKSFKYIIKPVFEDLGYECKRSCDYPPGLIDTIMYKGIYYADFVLADISTLNPNALYELGVRHALKPFTTLVICEDGIFVNNKLPFDLSHLTALPYHHDGKALDIEEVDRFKKVLKNAITGMLSSKNVDSPVFAHLEGLQVKAKDDGSITVEEKKNMVLIGAAVSNDAKAAIQLATPTLTDMIENAKDAMRGKKFDTAIAAFSELLKLKPGDVYFTQQLALATYKAEDSVAANNNAFAILEQLNPSTTTDAETLGLAGAIHKNLYALTHDKNCLQKSLRFYERGYHAANSYYNGINAAFLYWKLASLADNKEDALFNKMQAKQIAKNVVDICNKIKQEENYSKRDDKQWVDNTLAEAYYGLDDTMNFNQIITDRKNIQTDFSEASFIKQFEELKLIKETVENILK